MKHWHIADWVKDIFASGAYAYPTVKARTFLSIPVQNTLYFAGEALYNGPAMGTVEAAFVSGREVVSDILCILNQRKFESLCVKVDGRVVVVNYEGNLC